MDLKALIAMSGGVDSSVAALLMKEKGYKCEGITLKLFDKEICQRDEENRCSSLSDVNYAQNVAERLLMGFRVYNFSDGFRDKVINSFIRSYENCDTPNPCIECNRFVKFKLLFDIAGEEGFDRIVTGHYARIEFDESTNRYLLKKAVDVTKDQSYVLYSLTQAQLKILDFPLGEMRKSEVRQIAKDNNLINAERHDSQDICFIPDGDYAGFIERYTGKEYPNGSFVDTNGNILGEHKGIIRYTIGQRRGLGLSLKDSMYVCDKCLETNTVTLGYDKDLFSNELYADNVNLISLDKINGEMRAKAKTRYSHKEQWATITQEGDNLIHVIFDEPQRAITKGQALVLYDNDVVVGGGTICKTENLACRTS